MCSAARPSAPPARRRASGSASRPRNALQPQRRPLPRRRVSAGSDAAACFGDVPAALPALTRAVKLQDKAAKVGFDWPSLAPVFDKLKEELGELERRSPTAASVTATGQDRRGVRRPAVRGRQCRPPPEGRSRGRAALGEPEIHPPLPPHRGAAGRARAQSPHNRRWQRWTACGTRPRPRSAERDQTPRRRRGQTPRPELRKSTMLVIGEGSDPVSPRASPPTLRA